MTTPHFFSQFPLDQVRAQYAKNAEYLRATADKLAGTTKKYRGFTPAEWAERADAFTRYSQMSDEALRAHMDGAIDAIRAGR